VRTSVPSLRLGEKRAAHFPGEFSGEKGATITFNPSPSIFERSRMSFRPGGMVFRLFLSPRPSAVPYRGRFREGVGDARQPSGLRISWLSRRDTRLTQRLPFPQPPGLHEFFFPVCAAPHLPPGVLEIPPFRGPWRPGKRTFRYSTLNR
jgi:hypothetical protein